MIQPVTTHEQLREAMAATETEHLEFKAAKNNFPSENLFGYCCALSNEGGGNLVLGVSDNAPRQIVGTKTFSDINLIKQRLLDTLKFRVDVFEIQSPDGRVLTFCAPGRPIGLPREYKGRYFMRSGEALVPMTPEVLQRIHAEATPDYSAEICSQATMSSLSDEAIEEFRRLWVRKTGNGALEHVSPEQLLGDAHLVLENGITWAALVLLGKDTSLAQLMPHAELIFEYRSSDASIEYQERVEFRSGFFLWANDIWTKINNRNELQSYRDGLFRYEIPAFNEDVVRESLLNAIAHREYRDGRSIFVRQFPQRLEIVSPGGFPAGITPENIIHQQNPRNRRIAEALQFCGLIERSGQGADRIFGTCIKEGKNQPDYSASDSAQVSIVLDGQLRNPAFVEYLQRLADERGMALSIDDFLVLDEIREGGRLKNRRGRLKGLLDQGVVEKTGRGAGTKYILSQSLYQHVGESGTYTRKKGLDDGHNRELLLQHIRNSGGKGASMTEFLQVLPNKSRQQIKGILNKLRDQGRLEIKGKTKNARWFLVVPKGT